MEPLVERLAHAVKHPELEARMILHTLLEIRDLLAAQANRPTSPGAGEGERG